MTHPSCLSCDWPYLVNMNVLHRAWNISDKIWRWCILLCIIASVNLNAQQDTRIAEIEKRLDLLNANGLPLNRPLTIVFNGPLRELLAFFSESSKINLIATPGLEATVSVSFTEVPARDVILYLCTAYQLGLRVTGNILELIPYTAPAIPIPAKIPDIQYDSTAQLLTLNLANDTLSAVARRIAEITQRNVIVDYSIRDILVSGFITGAQTEEALIQIAAANHLVVRNNNSYFKIEALPNSGAGTTGDLGQTSAHAAIQRIGADRISVEATNVEILQLVGAAATQLGISYYLLPLSGQRPGPQNQYQDNTGSASAGIATIHLDQATFSEFLDKLFLNTSWGYRIENGLYLIGQATSESLWSYQVYTFQNRSARGILQLVPEELLYPVKVDSMMELNSLIVSGPVRNSVELIDFFSAVDKLIPVVLIEVIVLDVQTDKLSDHGIEAGVASGVKPGGAIISSTDDKGGIDFNFSPSAINNLLSVLEGNGFIKLGRVNADFYLTLKAVQQEGIIDIKSTPKLSTLNSHKAILSIGQKRYFQEQQVVYPGNDRPIPIQANLFREVEANLDLQITPVVSGDEQVTMEIKFEQSEFIGESTPNAPPPQVKREFESMIRVRNGEMIVLGGLERESQSRTQRGLPWISRLPLIGWLFGRTQKSKSKGKLLIFVKPTIVN